MKENSPKEIKASAVTDERVFCSIGTTSRKCKTYSFKLQLAASATGSELIEKVTKKCKIKPETFELVFQRNSDSSAAPIYIHQHCHLTLKDIGFNIGELSNNRLVLMNKKFNPKKVEKPVKSLKKTVTALKPKKPIKAPGISTSYPSRYSRRVLNKIVDSFGDVKLEKGKHLKKTEEKRSCVYGHIQSIPIGTKFNSRLEASHAGVHRPPIAGIDGGAVHGCCSIAFSGGYEDDLDHGLKFKYSGEGGRSIKVKKVANPKTLKTYPQERNQKLTKGNLALIKSCEIKNPIRVIRGFKLKSKFAPEKGYRYDGLYEVEKYSISTGMSGYDVYSFDFKRLINQDAAPWLEEKKSTKQ